MYTKINGSIIRNITDIVGEDNIITDISDMDPYSHDETLGLKVMPEAVVRPSETAQISKILELANKRGFPVTPRGGGTGLTGGSLAAHGGIVMSFELLNSIIDIDTSNNTAVIEPGLINGVLQAEALKMGLFYPVNPASMDSCTLGGNTAQCTGGANTVRYGTTRNYITGMHALSGDGRSWCAGGAVVKNSTDNILIQLMCGSEGTLSVFTKLHIRLLQRPAGTVWIIAPFDDIKKIPAAASKIINTGFNPTMLELIDSNTLECCAEYLGMPIQYSEKANLLIRYDSNKFEMLEKITEDTGQLCMELGSIDVLIADSKKDQERIWKIRSSIHDAIISKTELVCEEDIVIPLSSAEKLITSVNSLADKSGYRVLIFGHLGDGNMHINYLRTDKPGTSKEDLRMNTLSIAAELGGKISGEHGIGMHKKPYFKKFTDPAYLYFLSMIKKQFDPANILNPGKLMDFPTS